MLNYKPEDTLTQFYKLEYLKKTLVLQHSKI